MGSHARRTTPVPFSFLSAFAELLLIAGVLLGAFFGWKYWVQPITEGAAQRTVAVTVADELATRQVDPAPLDPDGVPVRKVQADSGEQFGVLYIPRLGADWMRPITASVQESELMDSIGNYATGFAPGARGNFALAGHRTGWGDPFIDLPKLQPGDQVIVETVDGWFTYEFRDGTYITPNDTNILAPVPLHPGLPAHERFITLQTCNPPHHGGPEMFIGFGVLTSFTPRAEGAPQAVQQIQAHAAGEGNG